jgi:hypothetical protein
MGTSNALLRLGLILDGLRNADIEIREVTPSEGAFLPDERVSAEVEVSLSIDENRRRALQLPDGIERTEDGLSFALTVESDCDRDDVDPTELVAAFAAEAGKSGGEELPPYKDPNELRVVYETHDTFAEMTDALGVDVTPQTVRNHMIEHGIHEPSEHSGPNAHTLSSQDIDHDIGGKATETPAGDEPDGDALPADGNPDAPGGDGATGSPTEEALSVRDSVRMPDGVTVEDVRKAVRTGDTLYEISNVLDMDQGEAKNLLDRLNFLTLLYTQNSTDPQSDVADERITSRIRTAVTDGS